MTLTAKVLYHFTSSALAGWLAWRLMQATGWPCWGSSDRGDMDSTYWWRLWAASFCAVWAHIVMDVPEHGWTLPTLLPF